MAAIYLSQVRVSLAVLAIMLVTYASVLMFQQRKQRAFIFGGLAGGLVVATFAFAIALGGQSIAERTLTLFAQDPVSLYSRVARRTARLRVRRPGEHLSARRRPRPVGHDQRLLRRRIASRPLWAEIQVAGWAIDGGIPLVLVSVAALVVALAGRAAARALRPRRESTRVRWSRAGGEHRHRGAHLQLHAVCDADRPAVLVPRRRGAGDRHRAQHGAMSTWLLVSGDFTPYGGMDMANFALASYLARR